MMKNKKSLRSGVAVLIVAVLAITAFVRGDMEIWLLAGAFAVWGIWIVVRFGVPYAKAQIYHYKARKIRKQCEAQPQKSKLNIPDVSDPMGIVLLRHVNYRVSSYIQSVYPDATWEWREEFPERIIAKGGVARIQIFGVPDFNFADVTFDQNAGIHCSMLKIIPLSRLKENPAASASTAEEQPAPPQPNTVDPQVWYEVKARKVLKNLIADLDSRGHSSLTIKETGEIAIQQADAEIVKPAFENMPERMFWPRLVKVFEREGMAANITDNGLLLSW